MKIYRSLGPSEKNKETLKKLIYDNFNDSNYYNYFLSKALGEAKEKNAVMSMWNITKSLAQNLSKNLKQASTKWNLILSKDLGYSGFADKSGMGYIHPSEPMQAIFLNTTAFDVIERVENKPAKKPDIDIKIGDKYKDLRTDQIHTITGFSKNNNIDVEILNPNEDKPFKSVSHMIYFRNAIDKGQLVKI